MSRVEAVCDDGPFTTYMFQSVSDKMTLMIGRTGSRTAGMAQMGRQTGPGLHEVQSGSCWNDLFVSKYARMPVRQRVDGAHQRW